MSPALTGLKDQGLISIKELWVNIYPPLADSLSGDSPIGFMNRTGELVPSKSRETRLLCGVGAGGENPPATRLGNLTPLPWKLQRIVRPRPRR
jgi:hypothetical protein